MKTNFKKDNVNNSTNSSSSTKDVEKDLTQEEFEEYISKSGAKGSFMIYRSAKKDEELGIDEL
ncbi:hypothetical protein BD31_I0462 [Candidatus Nitrosopumilus salaria BD31]|uniref:Uncharacterized protein n=1 Tax=Candidatus Nitrosopumilus salarius BD31 TaxID=859350 RepID=I3D5C6_9ARCH|nr:hypothetical protein [Candidatus Nitrosopumilus salaria]EIJ66919.1 hypothetical protein BD31_I0462 [Candidatus Nitrosopumilus salaria BD31]